MRLERIGVITIVVLVALPACVSENPAAPQPASPGVITKGGDERTGHYDVVEGWWKAAPNHGDEWTWGQVAGVAVDHSDRIIVVTRGDWPADRSGPEAGSPHELHRGSRPARKHRRKLEPVGLDPDLTPSGVHQSLRSGSARLGHRQWRRQRPHAGLEVQQRRERVGDAAR